MTKLALLIAIASTFWFGYKYFDAETRIEAGVLNEILISGERDFLMRLPAIIKEVQDRGKLVTRLQEAYPEVAIKENGSGICWGRLKLNFSSSMQLLDVSEGCP